MKPNFDHSRSSSSALNQDGGDTAEQQQQQHSINCSNNDYVPTEEDAIAEVPADLEKVVSRIKNKVSNQSADGVLQVPNEPLQGMIPQKSAVLTPASPNELKVGDDDSQQD